MAIINSIRKRSGLLLTIVLVGVLLFILGDFLSGQFGSGREERMIGEVNGKGIPTTLFAQELEKLENQFFIANERRPEEYEKNQLKQRAWNNILFQKMYTSEFEKLGIQVTKAADGDNNEENDMLSVGKTMDPSLRALPIFKNPQTGQFDPGRFGQFLSMVQNPQNREQAIYRNQWISTSEEVYKNRLLSKYQSLLAKTVYITKAEAEQEYTSSEKSGVFDYLYIPLSAVSDSLVEVSESDLEEYLDNNKAEFDVNEKRIIDYVEFPIVPNAEDSSETQKTVETLLAELQNEETDTSFAKAKTDLGTQGVAKYANNELPINLDSSNLEIGTVYGPFLQNSAYSLYKFIGKTNDTTFTNPSASHILISTQGISDEAQRDAKREEANSILERAKSGENFTTLAIQFSDDQGSKQKGGDLGEFGRGQMVPPFEEAVFGASNTGVVPELVESQFGFHIINVTQTSDVDQVIEKNLFAQITKTISASTKTSNAIYRSASSFLRACKQSKDFDAEVEANPNLTKIKDITVYATSPYVGSLGVAKEIVTWVYQEEDENELSDLVKLDNKYVVAVVKRVIKKDDYSVKNLAEQIEPKVIEQKKLQYILDEVSSYSGSLEDIQASYNNARGNESAQFESNVNLTLASTSVGNAGYDPKAVGTAFSVASGQTSNAVAGDNGIYIFKAISITEPKEIADYSTYKQRLKGPQAGSAGSQVERALNKLTDVIDNRHLYY